MRNAMVVTAISVILSSAALAGDLDMSKFVGLWELDLDRTTAEIKKIDK